MKSLPEYLALKPLLANSLRNPNQKNGLFESDCEIIKLRSGYLASTTDSLSQEISAGLYRNPETWGWMAAATTISDLAASGAEAEGLLLSCNWSTGSSVLDQKRFFRSFNSALKKMHVPLLGGDTGLSASPTFTTTGLATSRHMPLTRKSVRPGDWLVLLKTHPFGFGPLVGLQFLLQQKLSFFGEESLRPLPDWRLTYKMRPWLRAAIDSSDGLGTSINIISELNSVGFDLVWSPELIPKKVSEACQGMNLSELLSWMGDHGDYHTLVFVPDQHINRFRKKSQFCILGRATAQKKTTRVLKNSKWIELPLSELTQCSRDYESLTRLVRSLSRYFKKAEYI